MISPAPFDPEILENNRRVVVHQYYKKLIDHADDARGRLRTPSPAKGLLEVPELFREALEHYAGRQGITAAAMPQFSYEEPGEKFWEDNAEKSREFVTYSVVSSVPGGRGQGSPLEQTNSELRQFLREERADPDNPGYNLAIMGQWIDSVVRLSCWAPGSRRAEELADWVRTMIKEYTWWFTIKGVSRIYFWERREDDVKEVKETKLYGKFLDFFVRTEEITVVREKQMEDLLVSISLEKY